MRLGIEKRSRIVFLYLKHNLNFVKDRYEVLRRFAAQEDIVASKKTISRILNHWFKTGDVNEKQSETRAINHTKITYRQLNALDRLIIRRKGISADKARKKLNLRVCIQTILNYLRRLGWKKIRTKYCQFVSQKNRVERFIYCNLCLISNETFAIFLDECTVEMVHEPKSYWYRERPDRIRLVGKYQHEASVHILGAISRRGRSKLMIFTGNFDANGFQLLCNEFLVPFIQRKFPLVHRVHMDNSKVHVSYSTKIYMFRNLINHFKTPAQSPDLNPIELVWNDLKNYLVNEAQPNTVNDLVEGIKRFWNTIVTIEYCNSKINHLNKVIQRVISLNGRATGL